jgi:hypothetical protein
VLAQARPGEQHPFRAKPGTIPFLSISDLAARSSGGTVLWANADLFAGMVNPIKPAPAEFRPATFGHEGQVYDGWETRRRRGATADAHDSAVIGLGVPGIVGGVVVDTRLVQRHLAAGGLRGGRLRARLPVGRGTGRQNPGDDDRRPLREITGCSSPTPGTASSSTASGAGAAVRQADGRRPEPHPTVLGRQRPTPQTRTYPRSPT